MTLQGVIWSSSQNDIAGCYLVQFKNDLVKGMSLVHNSHQLNQCCHLIADIQLTEIDESLWKMGMAYNRGYDKQGNHVGKMEPHC